MSQRTVLQGKDGWHYDYWFTKDGIYRVSVVSNPIGIMSSFLPIPLLLVFSLFFTDIQQDTTVEYIFLAAVFGGSLLSTRLPFLLADRKRKHMGAYFPRAKGNQKMTEKIEWSDVQTATLTRGRNLRIQVGGKYQRMNVEQASSEPLKTLFRSKIAKKFVAKD